DPKNIIISDAPVGIFPQFDLIDPHPTPGGGFGTKVSVLSNGNVVVTSPEDDFGSRRAGAVYLFEAFSGALISSLVGSHENDLLAFSGITLLSNGDYVVASSLWYFGRGAVTWGNGSTGISGAISDANSLIGVNNDYVGFSITTLSNGNYVI